MNRSQFRRDLVALLKEHELFVGTVTWKEDPVKRALTVTITAGGAMDEQMALQFDGEIVTAADSQED